MTSSPKINGDYTHHVFNPNQEMPSCDNSRCYTPTRTRLERMSTSYPTPPLPTTSSPNPGCCQTPSCQSQLQSSPITSSSHQTYWQPQYTQHQSTPVSTPNPNYGSQCYQSQNVPMTSTSAGYYGGQYNQHLKTTVAPHAIHQHYGLYNPYYNSLVQPSNVTYQHNSPYLQQQNGPAPSTNPGYHGPYVYQYAGTQVPVITTSYWNTQHCPYQCQNPMLPATAGCVYSSECPPQCESTPEKPADSPAQHAPEDSPAQHASEDNTVITPVSSIENLDKIVHDFETSYSSPTKRDDLNVSTGKFVKKMVAALEHKYPASTSKSFLEISNHHNYSKDSKYLSAQKSFNETFASAKGAEKSISAVEDHHNTSVYCGFNDTSIFEDDYNVEMKVEAPEAPPEPEPKPDPVPEPEPEPQQKAQVQKNFINYVDTEIVQRTKRAPEPPTRSDSLKTSSAPKIIGAKLKNPIEVDADTAIDWIPIRNQKLPRKKSFKELLSLLIGKKKQIMGSKLLCNLNRSNSESEPHHRNSEFVEKSTRLPSSLQSSDSPEISTPTQPNQMDPEPLTKQPNSTSRSTSISSFQNVFEDPINSWLEHPSVKNSNNIIITDEKLIDDNNKIVLEEVDRADVRLSLGPIFPILSMNIFTGIKNKLRDNTLISANSSIKSESLFKSSIMSPLESPTSPTSPDASQELSKSSFSLPKKDSSRNCQVKQEVNNSDKSSETACSLDSSSPTWDLPSRHYKSSHEYLRADWSQSEPFIYATTQSEMNQAPDPDSIETIYDIPRPHSQRRPKSSIYEDALSVKRRTESFDSRPTTDTDDLFGSQNLKDFNFATVRPRARVLSSQQILRSMAQNDLNQLRAPYLVNRLRL